MRIRSFDYWEAPSLKEALTELSLSGKDVKVIAGGTDLVLNMKKKNILPSRIISLHNLKELDFTESKNSTIRIGSLSRHADLATNPLLQSHFPILCEAVGLIGSWQIRNVGTIGGNICNASPAADSAPPLLVLNAQLILASKTAEKKIPIDGFFTGPGESVLAADQILKEIVLKIPQHPSTMSGPRLRTDAPSSMLFFDNLQITSSIPLETVEEIKYACSYQYQRKWRRVSPRSQTQSSSFGCST